MKIFDRDGRGADEIVNAIGIIGNDVDFTKWRPLLHFGMRDVAAIIGHEAVSELCRIYEDGDDSDAVALLQQSVAFFTWLKLIPTLDAQHDSTGRARRIGENEKGLTALEQWKDEENIRHLAYEAVDALVAELESLSPAWWADSPKCMMRRGLFIQNKAEFDEYYNIGSHRLYMTLIPIIREVQRGDVVPVLGSECAELPLVKPVQISPLVATIRDEARRAVALLSMKKAVERLPVEVLPDGVVQVQQSAPVKQRLKAEKEARNAVAAALAEDGRRALERLAAAVAEFTADDPVSDTCVPGPIIHSKGMTF